MSYRLALLIFALSFLFLVGFSATAGMSGVSVWLAIAFFVLYFMVNIAVTRMRVEMGVLSMTYTMAAGSAVTTNVGNSTAWC
jgi:hypothetical protein